MDKLSQFSDLTLDGERALYNICGAEILNCVFAGKADGESALKECSHILVKGCKFSLRYPLWHAADYKVEDCSMDVNARAAVWYGKRGDFKRCVLNGIKVFRECSDTTVENCAISSFEAMWHCDGVKLADCEINSEYLLLAVKMS